MNILIITKHLNVGGITSYLFGLCRHYQKKGHHVFLISSGGLRQEEFRKLGVVLCMASVKTKVELNPRLLLDIPKLLIFIRQNRIDIIHAHTRVTQCLGQVLSLLSGVPYVSTCHGFYKTHWFRKTFPCWGRAVIAISPPVSDHLHRDFNVPKQHIFQIQNGVDIESFYVVDDDKRRQARQAHHISAQPVIGIVARLADVKGHHVLIAAMPYILKQFPHTLLFIAGEGKMESRLKAQSADLGLTEHIRFSATHNPSSDILALFDVFVMPSLDEGFGLSGMEAQAAALPVVASDVGGIPTFVLHEKTGLLVPPSDPQALAAQILRFLGDRDYARQIGLQSRAYVMEKFSLQITGDKTLMMYESILSDQNKSGL